MAYDELKLRLIETGRLLHARRCEKYYNGECMEPETCERCLELAAIAVVEATLKP